MSKQAEAAAIAVYRSIYGNDPRWTGKREFIVKAIREAYAEREKAVAELVEQSKIAATKLMRAYLDCSDLTRAIAAVEGQHD